jgi:hypothetical protein
MGVKLGLTPEGKLVGSDCSSIVAEEDIWTPDSGENSVMGRFMICSLCQILLG